ncbi:MAG: FkbM family methyltransferase [Chloroflexota bacterium]
MKTLTLPNGLHADVLDAFEARVLYREIFEMGIYTDHGLHIHEGDCVVDIGANVGLFSLMALQAGRNIRLFAAEPIPALHEPLRRNLERYAGQSQITLLPFGLSAHPGEAEFVVTPHSSMTTTMHPTKILTDVSLMDRMDAALADFAAASPDQRPLIDHLRRLVSVPVLGHLTALALSAAFLPFSVRNTLLTQRICCSLRTLSQVIDEYHIETIDLLKIDVEGSEAEVVQGIAEVDWARIRQIVIEVHDVEGRAEELRALLERQGYQTYMQQPDWALLHLMHIYTLYGIRTDEIR